MKIISRYGLGIPLASLVTVGLTLSMAKMITTEFEANEKIESADYSIDPRVEDIVTLIDIKQPKLLDKVEVPPPAPRIEKTAATSVFVAPIVVEGKRIDFDPTDVEMTAVTMVLGDTNEQPLFRVPPSMPTRATKSGYCDVRFNVNAEGVPFDIETTYCTEQIFERPTLKSVSKWKYRPRIENGQATTRRGVTNRVRYNLSDERGNLIPI